MSEKRKKMVIKKRAKIERLLRAEKKEKRLKKKILREMHKDINEDEKLNEFNVADWKDCCNKGFNFN